MIRYRAAAPKKKRLGRRPKRLLPNQNFWLLDLGSNQGPTDAHPERIRLSRSPTRRGLTATAFTAFTAFHPTDHENCQDGSPGGGGCDSEYCRRSKAVKAVKPVILAALGSAARVPTLETP
jgi:hypothetical protein